MRLTSWEKKGLAWGEPVELTGLQNCIKNMKDKKIKLVNVVQVMLVCGSFRAKDGFLICGSSSRPNTRRFKSSMA